RRPRSAAGHSSVALMALRPKIAPPERSAFRPASNLLNRLDAGHEMAEQVFDAALERGGGGGAARAGALHVQEYRAFLETLEDDVAAIHGHGRTYPGGQKLLDDFHHFLVVFFVEFLDLV